MTYDALDDKLGTNHIDSAISESSEKKTDIHDIVNQVFSNKDLKAKSILTPKQIAIVAACYAFADMYEDTEMRELTNNLLTLQISMLGKGRNNLVTVLSTMLNKEPEEQKDKNFIRKLFGF
jgi:hypothetical protein